MTTGLPQRRGAVGRASPILAVVGVIAVAFMIVRISPLGPPTSGNTEVESGHRSSNLQRHRRALEEEPYDIYLGLAPKKVVRPRGLQQAPETARRGLQAPLEHSISMSMSLSLPPTNAPSKVPTPSPSSPCGLDGIWEPAEDVCELMVIAGGDVQGVCNQNDQLEFYTDPIGTTGTLKGVKRRMSQDGTIESVNLIGFYHEEDCSFSAVSTTTDMTIKGKVYSRQHMQVDETEPGRSGVAITQSGKFKHTGDVTQVPSKAPTLSPSTSNPTKAPTQSPSSQPSKVRNGL